MAGYDYALRARLQDLRAWRAFLVEVRGQIYGLSELSFVLGLPLADALAAFGLGNSVWAQERWGEIRRTLDEPVAVPDMFLGASEPELDAAA